MHLINALHACPKRWGGWTVSPPKVGAYAPDYSRQFWLENALRLSALVEELALPASSTRLVRVPSDMMTGQSEVLHNAVRENTWQPWEAGKYDDMGLTQGAIKYSRMHEEIKGKELETLGRWAGLPQKTDHERIPDLAALRYQAAIFIQKLLVKFFFANASSPNPHSKKDQMTMTRHAMNAQSSRRTSHWSKQRLQIQKWRHGLANMDQELMTSDGVLVWGGLELKDTEYSSKRQTTEKAWKLTESTRILMAPPYEFQGKDLGRLKQ